ncbi:Ig-like domain-containing protein [Vibrio metschnikovii]|uniref:Ig-like domain-containing protein n=1 Tax=Vibrio metschnikovii TaxID=28172 RepID=UPI0029FB0F3D|nr:Ig-like domain-containing protein [Vibrio metschnikovii]
MKKYLIFASFLAIPVCAANEFSQFSVEEESGSQWVSGVNHDRSAINALITEITVTPLRVSVLKGSTLQLIATTQYGDGTKNDVDNLVKWEIVGDQTIAQVSPSGLLTGLEAGTTELIVKKDGIVSKTVTVTVCSSLAGPCIDIVNVGKSEKLFTSSPSKAYLDSIGGSPVTGIHNEKYGTYGPLGTFYIFNWHNATELCNTYNRESIGGRTNWRLATRDELKEELYNKFGNMFGARGWPTTYYSWSATIVRGETFLVRLDSGDVIDYNIGVPFYASCASNP